MAPPRSRNKQTRRSFGRVELRPSGRYRAGYIGPDGKLYRPPSTFDSKDDAIAWLAARRAEIQLNVWAPELVESSEAKKAVPTFEEYAQRWLKNRKTRGQPLRPTTRDHYQYILDGTLYPTFGGMPIDEISVDDVNDWYETATPGRESQRGHAYSLFRTILGTAASTRPKPLIPFNPAHIRGAGNVKPAHKVRPASLQQLEVLVQNLPDRYRLMALLAAWCAMRFGELAELRRGDIDLKHKRIEIRRGVVRVRGEMIVGPPKTDAGIRDVSIPPHLMRAVEDHLDRLVGSSADALVFPSSGQTNRHMQPSTLYKVFYPAREAAGRKDLRWHDLRHTGAVLAAQTGATLAELMGRLGHTTPGAAMRYQHAAADRDAEIARRLSQLAGS
ncbi:tyrosine-type recombinase/integrase [Nocardioides dongxiaopingii]|uniref:tyrosine-type recombinase/integrase n=1 Tax=Nocardioides dongxiaopingii TaxID=2576036 RepID=UPI0010C76A4B|nr:site-specific integrase [Nocardioides dongxiaopingii]